MKQEVHILFHLYQVRVNGRRLSHDMKERDGSIGCCGYRASKFNSPVNVLFAPAANQDSFERLAAADDDKHRRGYGFDYLISFRGHQKRPARPLARRPNDYQVISSLLCSLDYLRDRLASLDDKLRVDSLLFKQLLRAPERIKYRILFSRLFRNSKNSRLSFAS